MLLRRLTLPRWACAAGLLLVAAAWAAPVAHEVDPAHSFVLFRVSHLGAGNVYGRFNQFQGTFVYDAATPANSAVNLTVQTASVDTGVEARDKHLRTPDFFDAEKYPTISFKSTSVKPVKVGEATLYEVTGDLTLMGVTKPLTCQAVLLGEAEMRGQRRVGFETTFFVKRSEFGMTKMMPAAGDNVRLTVALEGIAK